MRKIIFWFKMTIVKCPSKLSIIPKYSGDFLKFSEYLSREALAQENITVEFPVGLWTYPAGIALLAQYASQARNKGGNLLCRKMPYYITEAVKGNIDTILGLTTIDNQSKNAEASEKYCSLFQILKITRSTFLDT